MALSPDLDQPVALEPLDRHGDGGRGHVEPPRECDGLDDLTLGLRLGDGLEVVLLGNGDAHAGGSLPDSTTGRAVTAPTRPRRRARTETAKMGHLAHRGDAEQKVARCSPLKLTDLGM